MGSSSDDDTSESEGQAPVVSEKEDTMENTAMIEMEFRPLAHPVEPPPDEDQPVKCPMCVSPAVKVGEKLKDPSTDRPVKKMEFTDATRNRVAGSEHSMSIRARKRHHNQAHVSSTMSPRMSIPPSPQPQDSSHEPTITMSHVKS
ncbi:hypothetical protein SAY86_026000 [Trapa natans]|uniref:Uncharacterized protein n=1 Tax=Trapa natans TaxID=22666 RepID=A0AAN7KCY2_TRANT|nr:hypothetical protein SAY86_026000 [Trapa natans]